MGQSPLQFQSQVLRPTSQLLSDRFFWEISLFLKTFGIALSRDGDFQLKIRQKWSVSRAPPEDAGQLRALNWIREGPRGGMGERERKEVGG